MEKYRTKARQKHSRANSKFCISVFDVRGRFRFPTFQLWCLQHTSLSWTASTLFAVLFGRYHRALASPTLWGLQCSPHFIFSASYSGLSGPTCRYSPVTHLASTSFLNVGGRFYSLFTWVFLPLKPELRRRRYQVLLHSLGWGRGPSLNYICITLICWCSVCWVSFPFLRHFLLPVRNLAERVLPEDAVAFIPVPKGVFNHLWAAQTWLQHSIPLLIFPSNCTLCVLFSLLVLFHCRSDRSSH